MFAPLTVVENDTETSKDLNCFVILVLCLMIKSDFFFFLENALDPDSDEFHDEVYTAFILFKTSLVSNNPH